MDKSSSKTFTTSRGFIYSYHRCEPTGESLEKADPTDPPLPVLLFLHGFPTSSLIWKHQIKYFQERRFAAIVPDLLGFGGTSKPKEAGAYKTSLICQDLIELLDAEDVHDHQVVAIGHDQGSRIASRLAGFYPNRCRAYAFIADPYNPPRPMTDLDFSVAVSKKMAGYELRGHSLFFAEDGADNLIESHLESFFSVVFPKDPKLWVTELAPVGALKSWLEKDKRTELAPYIKEDLEVWRTNISRDGVGAALFYHKAYVSGLNAEDDKPIPAARYSIEKPVFFAAAHHDYISRALIGISQIRHHCKDATIREYYDGHWLMISSAGQINVGLYSWIMDCI